MAIVFHNWHCDHLGHVNTRHYHVAFDDALVAFWAGIGSPGPDGEAFAVTARMLTEFKTEALAGTVARIDIEVDRIGGKSVTLGLSLKRVPDGTELARCEVTEVFFDPAARTSAPIPERIRAALTPSEGS
jgi:acyl-CoA thioester hydrolase